MRTSVEMEFWVIDREGALCGSDGLADISPQVEEEFVEPLLEVKTTPCDSVDELRRELAGWLEETLRAANEREKGLVPLGTPIHGGSIDPLPSERTRIQRRVLGEDFEYVKHCAGTHVHFEKRSIVDQLNVLTALDPALALVSSSPYYEGRRVAAGARPYVYRKEGYARFPKHGRLWEYVGSVSEWDAHLERRYVEFERAALDAGVSRAEFEASFTPDDAVWTPVRLRKEFPTVEWRSPDTALPSQVLRLAEELYGIVARANEGVAIGGPGLVSDDGVTLPAFDTVREHTDDAIREGLESERVRSYLDRMGFDVDAYDPLTHRIDRGPSVSRDVARELRLEYAEALERDVSRLARAVANRS
jgi:gamma-glutamyl:cysteine ligase YbdK (ATP-grasp superfamily)